MGPGGDLRQRRLHTEEADAPGGVAGGGYRSKWVCCDVMLHDQFYALVDREFVVNFVDSWRTT